MTSRQKFGLGFLSAGVLWAAFKVSRAIERGPGGVPQETGGVLQEITYYLPGLVLVIGLLLLASGGRKKDNLDKKWIRIVKVLVGGWVAAGGMFIVMQMAALAFFGSDGVKRLFDYSSPIVLALATIMCLTLMRRLK